MHLCHFHSISADLIEINSPVRLTFLISFVRKSGAHLTYFVSKRRNDLKVSPGQY